MDPALPVDVLSTFTNITTNPVYITPLKKKKRKKKKRTYLGNT